LECFETESAPLFARLAARQSLLMAHIEHSQYKQWGTVPLATERGGTHTPFPVGYACAHYTNPAFRISGQVTMRPEMSSRSHCGHIITTDSNDNADILSRRNILCRQTNNIHLISFFGNRNPFVKRKLLATSCFRMYGRVLWDPSHLNIETVCSAWQEE
jgi:hypothetical protein